jgi:hypothetical protein
MASYRAVVAAIAASAAATSGTIPTGYPFNIVALVPSNSSHPIHEHNLVATQSGLRINFSGSTNTTCSNGAVPSAATFQLVRGNELFLYNTGSGANQQQLWTDRSGMGQGALQYTRDAEQAANLNPNRIETKGWLVAEGQQLKFRGVDFIACTSFENSWSVWLDAGVANPGFNQNCTAFIGRVAAAIEPVGCIYSTL